MHRTPVQQLLREHSHNYGINTDFVHLSPGDYKELMKGLSQGLTLNMAASSGCSFILSKALLAQALEGPAPHGELWTGYGTEVSTLVAAKMKTKLLLDCDYQASYDR